MVPTASRVSAIRAGDGGELPFWRGGVALQPAQRLGQPLFNHGEIATERIIRQIAAGAERRQQAGDVCGCIALRNGCRPPVASQLGGRYRSEERRVWKEGDRQCRYRWSASQ